MVDFGSTNSMSAMPRNRFGNRLNAKSIGPSPLSNIPESINRNAIGELNRRITDLKMEPGTFIPPKSGTTELIQTSPKYHTSFAQPQIRRDSNQSTTSSSYYSMRSADMSRRGSQASQVSSISTMRPNYNTPSCYDPISPGCSRRSSQMSTATTGGQSLPPPPSSHLLSSHLQRLQSSQGHGGRHSFSSTNPGTSYGQNYANNDRRFSEPVAASSNFFMTPQRTDTNNTTPKQKLPSPTKEFHPNQEVDLDEVEENEMVENKLVIPDEMLQYLNEVADTSDNPLLNTITNENPSENSNGPTNDVNMYVNSPASCLLSPRTPQTPYPQQMMSPPVQQPPLQQQPPPQQMNPQNNYFNPPAPLQTSQSQTTSHQSIPTPNVYANVVGNETVNRGNQQNQFNSNHNQQYCMTSVQQQQQMYANNNGNATMGQSFNHSRQMYHRSRMMPNNVQQQHQQHQANMTSIACHKLMGYFHRTDQSAHNCCLVRMMQNALNLNGPSASAMNGNNRNHQHHQNYNTSNMTQSSNNMARCQMHNPQMFCCDASVRPIDTNEIQCGDISQSQMSPAGTNNPLSSNSNVPDNSSARVNNVGQQQCMTNGYAMAMMQQQQRPNPMPNNPQYPNLNPPPSQQETINNNLPLANNSTVTPSMNNSNNNPTNNNSNNDCPNNGTMRQDTYQRTLEYVQNCQNWIENTSNNNGNNTNNGNAADMVSSSTHPSPNMIVNDLSTSLNSYLEEDRYLQMIQ